jgi:hypothetical protein
MESKRHRQKRRRQEIEAMTSAINQKRRALSNSKPFLIETKKLMKSLEDSLVRWPDYLKAFFRQFGYPTGRLKTIRRFLTKAPDQKTKEAIKTYLRYVARFGVLLRLRKGTPKFKPTLLVPWGSTFRVRIKKGQFLPVAPYPGGDEPYVYFFESDPRSAPQHFQKLIKSGAAKYVELDDKDDSSLFARLESFAYHPEGITFVVHRAEQPYLFCLIGESVTNEIWRDTSKAVSAFHRALLGKGNAGRPPNIKRLKLTLRMRERPLSKKEIASALSHGDSEKDFRSAQAYLSQIEKLLR